MPLFLMFDPSDTPTPKLGGGGEVLGETTTSHYYAIVIMEYAEAAAQRADPK
jgi:hypothetical protein